MVNGKCIFLVPWYILKQNCLSPGGCSNKISKIHFSQICRLQSLRSRWGYIDSCTLARPLTLPFNMNYKRDTIIGSIAKTYPHYQYWAFGIKEKKKTFLLCKLKPTGQKLLATIHSFSLGPHSLDLDCAFSLFIQYLMFNWCLNWMWILYDGCCFLKKQTLGAPSSKRKRVPESSTANSRTENSRITSPSVTIQIQWWVIFPLIQLSKRDKLLKIWLIPWRNGWGYHIAYWF